VTDLIAHKKLMPFATVSIYFGNEFFPNKLLKYRFKFVEEKGKSLFKQDFRLARVTKKNLLRSFSESDE